MLMLCNNRINIIVYEHYNTAFFNLANSRQQESRRCPVRLGTQVPVPYGAVSLKRRRNSTLLESLTLTSVGAPPGADGCSAIQAVKSQRSKRHRDVNDTRCRSVEAAMAALAKST